jgi:Reverse transcriptase (RNA-dependent DNA polymerase)
MKTSDKEYWKAAVDEKHQRMIKHNVWAEVQRDSLTEDMKIITSTWAMKKKSNGVYRARLAARGFEQQEGIHYDSTNTSSPVMNDITIRVSLILAILAKWHVEVVDVKGAFLHGEFEDGEIIHMEIPKGFERFIRRILFLKLKKTLYGIIHAAMAFWRKVVLMFASIGFKRSKADPCLYYKWFQDEGLSLCTSFIDDKAGAGTRNAVLQTKCEIRHVFDCDEVGVMKEYIGCKIEHDQEGGGMKITQPVFLQSLQYEFTLRNDILASPAVPSDALTKAAQQSLIWN